MFWILLLLACSTLWLRPNLFGFFLKFINWNLSDKHWKIILTFIFLNSIIHRNVGLLNKSKLSFSFLHLKIIFVVRLRLFRFFSSFLLLIKSLFDFSKKCFMSCKKFFCFNSCNYVDRNVWCYLFKSSMNVNRLFYWPNDMSKSLNWVELCPFGRFSIINFKSHYFSNRICSSSNYKHKRA